MSQTLYRELHPATAVTHCTEAYFTHSKQNGAATAPNLVLARGNRLEVYCLNYALPSSSPGSSNGGSSVTNCRLELVGSWQCWGVVQDMAVLRGRGNSGQRDSIVVSFRDAKIAVVEWDDQLHCLRSGSLHSFEGDPFLREGCPCGTTGVMLPAVPKVAADPLGRCAAALVYGRHLAILPAIQADLLDTLLQEGGSTKGSRTSASVGNSYLVHLAKMPTIKLASDTAVRSMTFLHGYTEPVLLLLHESAPTWGGRLRDVRDTCCLSAMSINIRKKRQPVIWSVQHLPSDCTGVMAVPRGGVLVLSQNLLMYYAQGGSCLMAINSNAFAGEVPPRLDPPAAPNLPSFPPRTAAEIQAATAAAAEKAAAAATAHAKQWAVNIHPEAIGAAAKGAPKAPGMELEADGAVGCWLANNIALLSLKTGHLLLVALRFEAAAANKMQVMVAGNGPVASCASTLTSNMLFLGSCCGDSLLVRYTRETATSAGSVSAAGVSVERAPSGPGSVENPAKRRRLSSLASFDMGGGMEGSMAISINGRLTSTDTADPDDEFDIFGSAVGRTHTAVMPLLLVDGVKHSFRVGTYDMKKVLDSLMCLGPMRSTDIAPLHLRESDVHASLSGGNPQHKPSQCLIAAVGSDKSGALAIMQRGVVPDVITAVPGLEAHGAWTLHYRETKQSASGTEEVPVTSSALGLADAATADGDYGVDLADRHHAFLLLSCKGQSTMVLDARGEELAEITEQVAYVRDAPTIAAGEMFGATAAVQVTHSTVRLVQGSSFCLQDIPLTELLAEAGHPALNDDTSSKICIKYAQVRAPYVALSLSDYQGTVLLLQGDPQQQRLVLVKASLGQLAAAGWEDPTAAVTAVCLYTDTTGWLAAATSIAALQQKQGELDGSVVPGKVCTGGDTAAQDSYVQGTGVQLGLAAADDDEDDLIAQAAAEAPAAGESPASAAADDAGQQQQQQQDEQPAAVDAGEGEDRKVFVVPESDAAAAGVLNGVEGVDAAMAEAAADGDPQEAAAAAAAVADGDTQEIALAAADDGTAPEAAAAAVEDAPTTPPAAVSDSLAVDEGAAAAVMPSEAQPQQEKPPSPAAAVKAGTSPPAAEEASQEQRQVSQEQQQEAKNRPPPPASFCCVVRANGSLELYALPHMIQVFQEAQAALGHQVMTAARPESPYSDSVDDDDLQTSTISEIMMECFAGSSGAALGVPAAAAPLLVMLRDDGQCLIYKAYKAACTSKFLGFRRQPLDAELLHHQSPVPPPAATPAEAPAVGMPLPSAPPCRLVRFDHLVTPRLEPPLGPGVFSLSSSSGGLSSTNGATSSQGPKLQYSGIFLCGPKPVWLVANRGGLVVHRMHGDTGAVDAFCAFHNPSCPHGYIAASLKGELNICTLPLQMRLDQAWLTSKLPLRATPQALVHYPEARLIALLTSRLSAPPRPFLPADPGGDAVAAAAYATAEAAEKATGCEELSELQLLAPPGCGLPISSYTSVAAAIRTAAAAAGSGSVSGSSSQGLLSAASLGGGASSAKAAAALAAAAGWVGLPMWRYSLLPGERALCLKNVALCEGGDEKANPEPFIAVGCASTFGEDYPALGRVLLFQVLKDTVFRLEGGSEVKVHARLALQREYPGPVTSLECLRGFLLMGVGNRVELHYKQGNTLVKVTFFDGLQLVTGLRLVKDYILIGQVAQSCAFMRYSSKMDQHTRERQQQLEMLGYDMERVDATVVEFMANGKILSQVLADGGGNLTVLAYDKMDVNSWGGKKLMRRGAAHVGCHITQLERLRMLVPGDSSNRQALLAATSAGGMLLLSPLWDEHMYKRMAGLHEELVYQLQHTAGLNPKAFQARYCRAGPAHGASYNIIKPLAPDHNTMLQGDLMWAYAGMDVRAQTAIAEALGLEHPDALLQDLRALNTATDFL